MQDGFEEEVLGLIRATLQALGPLDTDYEREHPDPHIRQAFFHLRDTSRFLLLDIGVQSHSRNLAFRPGQDAVMVLFDRANAIRFEVEPFDLTERCERLEAEFNLFQRWVDKHLSRGHYLEAVAAYHAYTLEPLVEALRLQYAPLKWDYGFKHSYHDLPATVTQQLEGLFSVSGADELRRQHARACRWFHRALTQLKTNQM